MRTVQLNTLPISYELPGIDAVVISRKCRSAPVGQALQAAGEALEWLLAAEAERIFNKYCSTFDSTPQGNIGPTTDFLLDELGEQFAVVVPALPVNGRTVYCGNLFVNGEPLAGSGMRNHPVNLMSDSNLMRLMQAQSAGLVGLIDWLTIQAGVTRVRRAADQLRADGMHYVVCDTLTNTDLDVLGEAFADLRLVTGGSGLGQGLARAITGPGG